MTSSIPRYAKLVQEKYFPKELFKGEKLREGISEKATQTEISMITSYALGISPRLLEKKLKNKVAATLERHYFKFVLTLREKSTRYLNFCFHLVFIPKQTFP